MDKNNFLNHISSKVSNGSPKLKLQFKDIIGIFKLTWELFKGDRVIQYNFKMMLIYTLVFRILLFVLLSGFVILGLGVSFNWLSKILILITVVIVFMGLYGYFFFVYKRAGISCESWNDIMIKQEKCSEIISVFKKDIRLIWIIDMVSSFLIGSNNSSSDNKNGGIKDFIFSIFMGIIGEVADLVSNFLLPAIVVWKKTFREAINDLKELKNNLPATLMGVLWIDFIGSSLSTLLIPFYLLFILIFWWMAYGLGMLIKNGALVVHISENIALYLPAILMGIGILVILDGIIKTIVIFTKSVYFTLLYVALKKSSEIKDGYKENLINYLLKPFEKNK